MSMFDDLSDSAAGLHLEVFGETVEYMPAGSATWESLSVEVSRGRADVQQVADGKRQDRICTLRAPVATVSDPGPGDLWRFDGMDWAHQHVGQVVGGLVTLQVVRHERMEHGRSRGR